MSPLLHDDDEVVDTPPPSLHQFATHPDYLNLPLSPAQATILKAIEGEELTHDEVLLFIQMTGRDGYEPGHWYGDVTVVGGAGGGKDSMIAVPIALYGAFFGGWEHSLAVGGTPLILLMAQSALAGRVLLNYLKGAIQNSPALSALVHMDGYTDTEIRLLSGIRIRVMPCTMRSPRAESIPLAVLDELAYFRQEGAAESDTEIIYAIRRGMRPSFHHRRLLKISTPYLPEGELYKDYQAAHGKPHPTKICFQASTALLNPSSAQWVEEQKAEWEDPARFEREINAQFLDASVKGYIPRHELEACVQHEGDVPYNPRHSYEAVADPSGLTEGDTWTLAIGHLDGNTVMIDCLRGYDGTDEAQMLSEHAELLKSYGCTGLVGDRYAGELPAKFYRSVGVSYQQSPWDKSEAYLSTRKLIRRAVTGTAGLRLALPNHDKLLSQFARLEVEYLEGGRVKVDHPKRKNAHDDYSNAVAVVAHLLADRAMRQEARDVRQHESERFVGEDMVWDPRRWRPREREALFKRLDGLVQRALAAGWPKDNLDKLVAEAGTHLGKVSTLSEIIADKLNESGRDTLAERMRRGGIA